MLFAFGVNGILVSVKKKALVCTVTNGVLIVVQTLECESSFA
jgi:hypothetical protein